MTLEELRQRRFKQRDLRLAMAKLERCIADMARECGANMEANTHDIAADYNEEFAAVFDDMGNGKKFGVR